MTPEDYLLMCDAAKAAGYDIWWKNGTCKGGPYMSAFIGDKPWRPLEDDGDAFRLARACGMVVDMSRPSAGYPFAQHWTAQEDFTSLAAAARRVVVRCAAAGVGKKDA